MPRINLKYLAIGQFLVGAMLIALPIFICPHLIVITDEFPEMSSVLESLKAAPVESNNSHRAVEILEMQRGSLKALREIGDDLSWVLQICGLFMLFSGFAFILEDRRKVENEKNST